MKFNSFNWNLYKESQKGSSLIERFATVCDGNGFAELVDTLCPDAGINREAFGRVVDDIYFCKVSEIKNDIDTGKSLTAREVWSELISTGYMAESDIVIKPGDYKEMLDLIPFLSINLYLSFPDSFVPYFFLTSFAKLASLLDFYDIPIPTMPAKNDYEGRCYYYMQINDTLLDFREKIGLSPEEFCAFLYDFAPSQTEEIEIPSTFNRIWISGGLPIQKNPEVTYYWGNNPSARKGDLMLLYELAPVSAITSIWRLTGDGYADPFFKWNASASVKHLDDFPNITLKELREDFYFSNHPLVRRKMQGVNGYSWSMNDYDNLLRLILAKGYDVSTLPKMEALEYKAHPNILLEKDVEEKLLIPLLDRLGLDSETDYIRQLPIHAGRGHRIFPDFAVYYSDKPDDEYAHILIEAKLDIKNEKDLDAAFYQAKSYANILNSSVIILCDKKFLYIYEKSISKWDKKRYMQVSWGELGELDKYSQVGKIFDRKQYN